MKEMKDLSKLILTLDSGRGFDSLSEEEEKVLNAIIELFYRREPIKEEYIRFLLGNDVDIEKAIENLEENEILKFNP